MKSFTYNDMTFTVEKSGSAWDIKNGDVFFAAGLFPGLSESEAEAKAIALVKTVVPVGIKLVPPDTAHPLTIGDLKIVPPDVTHPTFIYWTKDSVAPPKQL